MKNFQEFLEESVTIHGDFNGTLNIGSGENSIPPEQQVEENYQYLADVVWMGSIYRLKLEQGNSARLPTNQELAEQLQSEYPGAIVQRIYPVETTSKVKISDVKRYHPAKLDWV
tara:strand:- start:708 stop:1049 length:342 start_codon:yes stop_codon:yes gene_type:complete